MKFTESEPLHLVRYGTTAEQKYLAGDFLQGYDVLVVNANMVSHTPSAIAGFIGEKAKNKAFIIDPQTHAFQHDITLLQTEDQNGPKLRRSIEKLVQAYGNPIASKVSEGEVVLPDDFEDLSVVNQFAHSVGIFQWELLYTHALEKGLTEYYEFVGVDKPVRPLGIVAPYFYMEPLTYNAWIKVNMDLINATAKQFPTQQIFAELVISKDILYDEASVESIVQNYADAPVDAVFLWIDNFSEHSVPTQLLLAYAQLVRRIGKKRPVVMLYGSYFSTSLMRFADGSGLGGVCHGLEYGEDRAVIPAVGGLPVSKFYYPSIHKRIRFPDALKLARQHLGSAPEFLVNVCRCKTCTETFSSFPPDEAFGLYGKSHPVTFKRKYQAVTLNYPDTDTRDRCVRHFMWNKEKEFKDNSNLHEVVAALRVAFGNYQRILGPGEVGHCLSWSEVLSKYDPRSM